MERAHSEFSPSASERWMNCTASIEYCKQFPSTTSSYADEGTLAHKIFELTTNIYLGKIKKKEYDAGVEECKTSEYFSYEMISYASHYINVILDSFRRYNVKLWATEVDVNLGNWGLPEVFGHVDFTYLRGKTLVVKDLKYGRGVKVDAYRNSQQMIYAAGAYLAIAPSIQEPILDVEIWIWQPRMDNYSCFTISVAELHKWCTVELMDRVKKVKENPEFKAGIHCKFCPAKGNCRTLYEYHQNGVITSFQHANSLTDQEVANILIKEGEITSWLKAIKEHATEQAQSNGKEYPGLKLVHGQSKRKYTDTEALKKYLLNEMFFREDQICEISLLSITEMEKLLGPELKRHLDKFTVKPLGSPQLVPEDSNKKAINDPSNYFKKL